MLSGITGKNIRSVRKLKGFSQKGAARRAGFTPSYWGYLERGQKNPSLQTIEKVAAVLRVEPHTLLVDSSVPGLPAELWQLLYAVNGMGPVSVKFISQVLRSYVEAHKRET
jgi:transcriptional regulator with XRE-family HTH domain